MNSKLKVIRVEDPHDETNPLGNDLQEDNLVVYHGTSSCYKKRIESKGWILYDSPHNNQQVKTILAIYDTLKLKKTAWYYELLPFGMLTPDKPNDRAQVRFSQEYSEARGYSIPRGGLVVEALLETVSFLMKNINRPSFNLELKKIYDETEQLVKDCYNIVYAVKVQPRWFSNWTGARNRDLKAIHSIPPESIIARIEFTNKIHIRENSWFTS